jgi:hypothetical protein
MTTNTTAYLAYGVVLQEPEGGWGYPDGVRDQLRARDEVCLEYSGTESEMLRVLCIRKTVQQTDWRPQMVLAGDLVVAPDWAAKLQQCCERLGQTALHEPNWLLFFTRL